jgi:hypothetical protein
MSTYQFAKTKFSDCRKIGSENLFVVDVGVLLLADVAVHLAAGTEVVGLGPCRQSAVVGRVLTVA